MDEGQYQRRRYQHYQQQQGYHPYSHDDYYYSRQQQQQQQQRQQRYRRPNGAMGSTNNDGLRPYFTGTNFSILVALFVIYFFQRKDGLGRIIQVGRDERGVGQAMMDIVLEVHDYMVGYYQMILEILRNLRSHLLAMNNGDDLFDFSLQDSPLSPSSSFLNMTANDGPRVGSGRNRRGMMGGVASLTSRIGVSSSTADMPELEEMDNDSNFLEEVEGDFMGAFCRENTDPLPPAFLRDEDYPPGWLVYDVDLGVVSKKDADIYHRRRQETKKQEQQVVPHQEQKDEQPIVVRPVESRAQKQQKMKH